MKNERLEIGKQYRVNNILMWYLGMEQGEHLFGVIESRKHLAVYPVTNEDLKLAGEEDFITERMPCYLLSSDTPVGPAFVERVGVREDTPFRQLTDRIPKEMLEGLI